MKKTLITNINKHQENVTNKEDIFNEFLENPRKILNNFEFDESASRYEKLATLLHNLGYSCNNENFLISTYNK